MTHLHPSQRALTIAALIVAVIAVLAVLLIAAGAANELSHMDFSYMDVNPFK